LPRQLFQAFSFRTVADDPVFASRGLAVEVCERTHAQMKTFQVYKPTDAD